MVNLARKMKRITVVAMLLFTGPLLGVGNNENPSCCDGLRVGGDFLYWKLCENNMDYALVEHPVSVLPQALVQENFKFVKHNWEPGFRVWAEKEDCCCGYNLYGSYTRFDTSKNAKTTVTDDSLFSTLASSDLNSINISSVKSIEARHHLRYQTFDALVSFDYHLCGCHTFTPVIGIEGLKLSESWKSSFAGFQDSFPATFNVSWDSDYQAIGLKVGTRYECDLSCGFSLFASGTFSLVTGPTNASNDQTLVFVDSNEELGTFTTTRTNHIKDHTYIIQPGAHLTIGLRYERCYCGKKFGVRIGYEMLDWWNVPTIRHFGGNNIVGVGETTGFISTTASTSAAGSNIMLHGLFAGAEVGF